MVEEELQELKHVPPAAVTGVGGTGAPQVGVAGDTLEPSLPDGNREYSPYPQSTLTHSRTKGL